MDNGLTRREFAKGVVATTAAAGLSRRSFGVGGQHVRLGLNTYSLRALPHDTAIATVIRLMKAQQLQECQLFSAHMEPPELNPALSVAGPNKPGAAPVPPTQQQLEERRKLAEARAAWRLSVPISHFEDMRATFQKEGLRIKAVSSAFSDSAEEMDRLFLMARALGAESVHGRLAEPITDVVASAATRHHLLVGIQVLNVTLVEQQLRAAPCMKLNPDAGDLTKVKIEALPFIQEHLSNIIAIDLKDAIAGTGSVPFGAGDAKLAAILQLLRQQQSSVPANIDCDYPGTGQSTEEVERCIAFARKAQA